ncbi:LmeA family phospholipid-binding protein [Mycolicibacterium thermoresistibile]|jgi:hypothetical protein|uniref:DUF2993 domain-containing protein n=2 Tax=Mycolicibacterium thermoresistibile TaxID=1797 RepID=G7CLT3_MYCT3|nr:LmeA family phospholipid-binding protein [Mycolicibacterium thermoresistibile]EHI10886.1 hypothetical protein KEK_19878 [Mycolicibacterium thermoresistibile ATCC 19527]MCV7188349.1 hypothetical protein [Mycolicibacterium thermoresistibile]GAT13431.1 putative uncharacterized protein [Mycolicibacterium thermoresistibile]SNW18395.1 Conserved exported protein of uncharacterised function [Mycolicibacterium thermoresistibile]
MTGPLRRLRPPHPLDVLSAVWSTAAATPVAWLVKGRRLTVNIDGADVSLTITDFDPRMDILRLSVGRLGRVELGACDIEWADNRIDRLTAVLHDVHLKPSVRPELVAGPVHLTADIPADVVPVWLASKAPRLSGDIDDDGVARIWLARRPHWGRLEIDARLERSTSGTATDHPADHSALWLHPRAVVRGRRRLRFPAWTPGYRFPLPELPHGLRVTGIEFAPGRLHLSGDVGQWRLPVTSIPPL